MCEFYALQEALVLKGRKHLRKWWRIDNMEFEKEMNTKLHEFSGLSNTHNQNSNWVNIPEGSVRTLTMAFIASGLRVGWCLINSSMAVPRLEAASPKISEVLLLFIAGRYSGANNTWKSLLKGLQFMNAWRPLAFRHNALRMLGSDANTSLVAGT